jgi:3D (Asp-Asp-Asp) domain-containing protein
LLGTGAPGRAENATTVAASAPAFSVWIALDGNETPYATRALTVSAFLRERGLSVGEDDYVSAPLDSALYDGMHLEFRPAAAVMLFVGDKQHELRSSAATVEALLASQSIKLGPNDEITPSLDSRLLPNAVVRIVRVKTWVERVVKTIPQPMLRRDVASLLRGNTRVIDPGSAGRRETTLRFVQRGDEKAERTVLASRLVRAPRPKIVGIGIAEPDFGDVARDRIADVVHIAGTAVQMVATAYVAGCYGCSGITAIGLPARHGIVAVDPRFIPLGTKLYVPGYGRALAGDTGGAIKGRRIDLGFNSLAAAIQFGRREIKVYVLR